MSFFKKILGIESSAVSKPSRPSKEQVADKTRRRLGNMGQTHATQPDASLSLTTEEQLEVMILQNPKPVQGLRLAIKIVQQASKFNNYKDQNAFYDRLKLGSRISDEILSVCESSRGYHTIHEMSLINNDAYTDQDFMMMTLKLYEGADTTDEVEQEYRSFIDRYNQVADELKRCAEEPTRSQIKRELQQIEQAGLNPILPGPPLAPATPPAAQQPSRPATSPSAPAGDLAEIVENNREAADSIEFIKIIAQLIAISSEVRRGKHPLLELLGLNRQELIQSLANVIREAQGRTPSQTEIVTLCNKQSDPTATGLVRNIVLQGMAGHDLYGAIDRIGSTLDTDRVFQQIESRLEDYAALITGYNTPGLPMETRVAVVEALMKGKGMRSHRFEEGPTYGASEAAAAVHAATPAALSQPAGFENMETPGIEGFVQAGGPDDRADFDFLKGVGQEPQLSTAFGPSAEGLAPTRHTSLEELAAATEPLTPILLERKKGPSTSGRRLQPVPPRASADLDSRLDEAIAKHAAEQEEGGLPDPRTDIFKLATRSLERDHTMAHPINLEILEAEQLRRLPAQDRMGKMYLAAAGRAEANPALGSPEDLEKLAELPDAIMTNPDRWQKTYQAAEINAKEAALIVRGYGFYKDRGYQEGDGIAPMLEVIDEEWVAGTETQQGYIDTILELSIAVKKVTDYLATSPDPTRATIAASLAGDVTLVPGAADILNIAPDFDRHRQEAIIHAHAIIEAGNMERYKELIDIAIFITNLPKNHPARLEYKDSQYPLMQHLLSLNAINKTNREDALVEVIIGLLEIRSMYSGTQPTEDITKGAQNAVEYFRKGEGQSMSQTLNDQEGGITKELEKDLNETFGINVSQMGKDELNAEIMRRRATADTIHEEIANKRPLFKLCKYAQLKHRIPMPTDVQPDEPVFELEGLQFYGKGNYHKKSKDELATFIRNVTNWLNDTGSKNDGNYNKVKEDCKLLARYYQRKFKETESKPTTALASLHQEIPKMQLHELWDTFQTKDGKESVAAISDDDKRAIDALTETLLRNVWEIRLDQAKPYAADKKDGGVDHASFDVFNGMPIDQKANLDKIKEGMNPREIALIRVDELKRLESDFKVVIKALPDDPNKSMVLIEYEAKGNIDPRPTIHNLRLTVNTDWLNKNGKDSVEQMRLIVYAARNAAIAANPQAALYLDSKMDLSGTAWIMDLTKEFMTYGNKLRQAKVDGLVKMWQVAQTKGVVASTQPMERYFTFPWPPTTKPYASYQNPFTNLKAKWLAPPPASS
ncbi:hypothetical protein IPJ72_00285 [Candidatus Peregrinibacteria bacterium]|nr:MAG: hypothetical protein IPJ72_00285 [Candidatus Peregrinibacteria bacterium]